MKFVTYTIPASMLIILLLIIGCSDDNVNTAEQPKKIDTIFSTSITPASISIDSSVFSSIPARNTPNPELTEASGVIRSLKYPGNIWTHEDSGSGPVIYMYDSTGNRVCKLILQGISATDCEDISIGYSLSGNKWGDIYLADIGDNDRKRSVVTVYSFPEPELNGDSELTMPTASIKSVKITYPDEKNNAEALFVDPIDSAIYIFTKYNTKSKVYQLKPPFNYTAINTPKLIGTLNIKNQLVTAADISDDGQNVVIKTYEYILYWKRNGNEDLMQTLQRQPTCLPYIGEVQGEAFSWSVNADKYYTWSETDLNIPGTLDIYYKK